VQLEAMRCEYSDSAEWSIYDEISALT
jgi:hypothetical protein